MKNEETLYVNPVLLLGLFLFILFKGFDKFIAQVPDIIAYPWMILSCVCMLIGVYRTGKMLGNMHKK